MTKSNNQAKHMKQNARKSNKGRIVAIALAGVLAIGGAGAVCVAGLGKMPNQAPAAAQMAAPASAATKAATVKKAEPKKTEAKNDAEATAKKASTTKNATKAPAAKKSTSTQQSPAPSAKKNTNVATTNQASTAKKAAPKAAAKQAVPVATKAAPKTAPKQATPAAVAKKAAPKVAAKQAAPAAKKVEAPKKAEAPKVQAPAPTSSNSGLEAKVSREQCIKTALAHVGAGGQAKGEAMNVTAKQVIGGGTVYYVVELDLGDVHYTVNVDAIDGNVIGADSTHAGKRVLLDKEGNPVAGTETEVDA
jgi:hypothetical protein